MARGDSLWLAERAGNSVGKRRVPVLSVTKD